MDNATQWQPANMDALDLLWPYLNEPRWLCWKYVLKEEKKPDKMPMAAVGDGYSAASSDHSAEWGTYGQAVRKCSQHHYEGIGFVLYGGIVGIDIDHRDLADPFVVSIIEYFDSYTELSPSKNGVHILAMVDEATLSILDPKIYGNKNKSEELEFYWSGRYFTFTGDVINEGSILDRSEEVLAFAEKYMKRSKPVKQDAGDGYSSGVQPSPRAPWEPQKGHTDHVVINLANRYDSKVLGIFIDGKYENAGYKTQSEADLALVTRLLYFSGGDTVQADRLFRGSQLMRPKWDVVHDGVHTYGQMTLDKAAGSFYPSRKIRECMRLEWEAHNDFDN